MSLPASFAMDSDCVIYLTELAGSRRQRYLLREGVGLGHPAICSTATFAEVLTGAYREDPGHAAARRSALLALPGFTFVELTVEIADSAARLRAERRLTLPDAINVATALSAGAAAFLTNDLELARRAAGLPIPLLVLDELIARDE